MKTTPTEKKNEQVAVAPVMCGYIKVCPNSSCSAIYHNVPKNHTKCKDCDGWLIEINQETYWKKHALEWFQYDFETEEYFRPVSKMISVDQELPKMDLDVWALCERADGTQSIHKIKRIVMQELFTKWQWSSTISKSYFTLKVTDWIPCIPTDRT